MLHKDYITTTEAGKALGFSRTHIIRLIESGEIRAKKVNGQYLIDKNSIGVLKNISNYVVSSARESTSVAFKNYGDIIRKLGEE